MKRKNKKILALLLSVTVIGGIATSCSNNKYKDLGNEYVYGVDFDTELSVTTNNEKELTSDSNAYYYMGLRYSYLTAIDKETGRYTVLCNKPDCLHDKETDETKTLDCNAFFRGMMKKVYYFNNKIYVLADSLDKKDITKFDIYKLHEVNPDGSGHEDILTFKQIPISSVVHRGYLYISFTDYMRDSEGYSEEEKKDLKYGVYRYDLSNPSKEREVIFEQKGKYGKVRYLNAIGNKIYMDNQNEEEENTMIYDIKKDKTYKRKENYTYTVRQNDRLINLNYKETTIKVTDFDDNIIDEIPIGKSGVPYCNDEIIAIDNINEYGDNFFDKGDKEAKRTITFYDKDYNKIQDVDINNHTLPVLGMDEKYLFFYSFDEENSTLGDLCILDLSKLGTEEFKPEVYIHYDGDKNPPGIVTSVY